MVLYVSGGLVRVLAIGTGEVLLSSLLNAVNIIPSLIE